MKFEQIKKHRPGGFGSPCIFHSDIQAERALEMTIEIKPGMRAVALTDGRVAIFRNSSKAEGTWGHDIWHGGWEANNSELQEISRKALPTFHF